MRRHTPKDLPCAFQKENPPAKRVAVSVVFVVEGVRFTERVEALGAVLWDLRTTASRPCCREEEQPEQCPEASCEPNGSGDKCDDAELDECRTPIRLVWRRMCHEMTPFFVKEHHLFTSSPHVRQYKKPSYDGFLLYVRLYRYRLFGLRNTPKKEMRASMDIITNSDLNPAATTTIPPAMVPKATERSE